MQGLGSAVVHIQFKNLETPEFISSSEILWFYGASSGIWMPPHRTQKGHYTSMEREFLANVRLSRASRNKSCIFQGGSELCKFPGTQWCFCFWYLSKTWWLLFKALCAWDFPLILTISSRPESPLIAGCGCRLRTRTCVFANWKIIFIGYLI